MKKKIGEIGVDAGMIWIGDPCYCVTPDCNSHPAQTWKEFCSKIKNYQHQQWNYQTGKPGLGVTVQSGYGDGCYPVYAEMDGHIVKSVTVVFDDDDDDEENEEE